MNIVGTKSAAEIAMTPQGANQHAHVLTLKSATKQPPTSPESDPMDHATLKAVLAFDDTTKAYFLGLDDKVGEAFLKKTADEQKAEALAAKTAADTAAAEAEALKAGISTRELEAEKRASAAETRLADLEKREKDREADSVIMKRVTADFAGFPGGDTEAFETLKAAAGLPEASRTRIEQSMKAQIAMAKAAGGQLGIRTEADLEKAAPHIAKMQATIRTAATAKGVSIAKAEAEFFDDPSNLSLLGDALLEEDRMMGLH